MANPKPKESLVDSLKQWADQQEIPFSMESVIQQLGLNPAKATRDLITRIAIDLRKAGYIKVAYREAYSNRREIRWVSEKYLEVHELLGRTQRLPASPALGELIAAEQQKARPRFPLLVVPQDPQQAESDRSADTTLSSARPAPRQGLAQWLEDVALWFRAFPFPR